VPRQGLNNLIAKKMSTPKLGFESFKNHLYCKNNLLLIIIGAHYATHWFP
jgi:hypothetical protein